MAYEYKSLKSHTVLLFQFTTSPGELKKKVADIQTVFIPNPSGVSPTSNSSSKYSNLRFP